MKTPKRIAELDGLRGIAILAVMALHLSSSLARSGVTGIPDIFSWGWAGVDLFFVLSGYLITGILLRERDHPHYFGVFYLRRSLRIWPLYYVFLAFVFLVLPLGGAAIGRDLILHSSPRLSYIVYLQNFLVHGNGYGPLTVTWSLAIEEQFYLLWPVLVFKLSSRWLTRILCVVLLLSPVIRLGFVHFGFSQDQIYHSVFCRLDGLAWGALLAIQSGSLDPSRPRAGLVAFSVFAVGLAGCTVAGRVTAMFSLLYSFIALSCTGLAALAFSGSADGWYRRVLRNGWLQYTGRISYGLYLLHLIAFEALRHKVLGSTPKSGVMIVVESFVLLGSAYAVASLSWFLFERPLLGLQKRIPYASQQGQARSVAGVPA